MPAGVYGPDGRDMGVGWLVGIAKHYPSRDLATSKNWLALCRADGNFFLTGQSIIIHIKSKIYTI